MRILLTSGITIIILSLFMGPSIYDDFSTVIIWLMVCSFYALDSINDTLKEIKSALEKSDKSKGGEE